MRKLVFSPLYLDNGSVTVYNYFWSHSHYLRLEYQKSMGFSLFLEN